MRVTIEPPPEKDAPEAPLELRIFWFVAIAVAASAATIAAAYGLKALIPGH